MKNYLFNGETYIPDFGIGILVHYEMLNTCTLRELVRFVQFKTREKYVWRSVTLSKVAEFTKINTPLRLFFTFFKL